LSAFAQIDHKEKGINMFQGVTAQLEALPLVLTMRHIQEITGLSKPKVYELPHMRGFPVVRFGRAIRVPRDKFFAWLDAQANGQEK
jgi:excisionase family DNA binding protein